MLPNIQNYPFLFLQNHQNNYYNQYSQLLNNYNENNCINILKEAYLSNKNIDYIQNRLKCVIYNNTKKKYIIPDQKREHLYQIMEGIMNDYCHFLPYNFKEQIADLNEKVIKHSVPYILNQIESQEKYLEEIQKPFPVMDRPENVSIQGKRTLPSMMIL